MVPLEDQAAVGAGSTDGHVNVVLVLEGVDGQRLRGHGLVEDEVRGHAVVLQAVLLVQAPPLHGLRAGARHAGHGGVGALQPRHQPLGATVALEGVSPQVPEGHTEEAEPQLCWEDWWTCGTSRQDRKKQLTAR